MKGESVDDRLPVVAALDILDVEKCFHVGRFR